MDLKKLLGMRPKTESIGDIQDALKAARVASDAAKNAEADLLAKRGDVLLGGTPEEVTRAEAALVQVRLEIERAATMVPILETRLAGAQREKNLAHLRAMVADASQKSQVAAAAIRDRYTVLATAIVKEVLTPEAEAVAAMEAAQQALMHARRNGLIEGDDALFREVGLEPLIRAVPQLPFRRQRINLGAEVVLPNPYGQGAPHDDEEQAPYWKGQVGNWSLLSRGSL